MTDLEVLVGLNCVDIGFIKFQRLLECFGTLQKIIQARPSELTRIAGIGPELAGRISALKKEDSVEELSRAKELGLQIITVRDEDYPQNLKEIYDPPILLYVKGKLSAKDDLSIAIVGSRRASFYGLNNAQKFAQDLADTGFTVVSGLARGVDTAAHKGALSAGGRTIAVIGSGFGQMYPPENKDLAEKIAQNGAVVSEFPVSMAPKAQNFPRRNRVISGLSKGVLVVEAARNSGALITADFALEQGREVFSLPGKIDAQNSYGTNFLIAEGAKPVSTVRDIIEELNLGPVEEKREVALPSPVYQGNIALDNTEKLIYNNLSQNPLTLDEISGVCREKVSKVLTVLLGLELKKAIRQLPGKRFIKEHNG
ncbi:MAG: DNA-processing protein DprA [Candidatus Omnitrophica bacterium]|nr:DNA-processing protein DprA [Candidatus Omnitrophota bacterium]MDD5236879.1 DNA-processing protein DprA [Candidatus Omnitrophota bacterium]MDD5610924.1 DNA-processing protein DprA [Candidatus Omnitrophota bacterium]